MFIAMMCEEPLEVNMKKKVLLKFGPPQSRQLASQQARQTDRNQCVAVCATAIMSFYGAKCLARLRAVREKMLMAAPVSLHHLFDSSYWE